MPDDVEDVPGAEDTVEAAGGAGARVPLSPWAAVDGFATAPAASYAPASPARPAALSTALVVHSDAHRRSRQSRGDGFDAGRSSAPPFTGVREVDDFLRSSFALDTGARAYPRVAPPDALQSFLSPTSAPHERDGIALGPAWQSCGYHVLGDLAADNLELGRRAGPLSEGQQRQWAEVRRLEEEKRRVQEGAGAVHTREARADWATRFFQGERQDARDGQHRAAHQQWQQQLQQQETPRNQSVLRSPERSAVLLPRVSAAAEARTAVAVRSCGLAGRAVAGQKRTVEPAARHQSGRRAIRRQQQETIRARRDGRTAGTAAPVTSTAAAP